jgi:hypothetical protein
LLVSISSVFTKLGQIWYLPAGEVRTASNIELPAGAHLVIDGTLRLAPKSTGSLLHVTGDNVLIEGTGTLDGQRALQTVPTAGIDTGQVSHLRVRDLTISYFSGWPVNIINSSSDVRLSNLTMTSSGAAPEFANNSHDCWATGLQVSDIDDYGFAFYGGVYRSGLSDSIFIDCKPGCGVLSDDAQPWPCQDILIVNVQVFVTPGTKAGNVEGMYIVDNTTAQASPPSFVQVSNCLFDGGSPLSGGQAKAQGTFTVLVEGHDNILRGITVRNSQAEYAILTVGEQNILSSYHIVKAGRVKQMSPPD